MGLYTALAAIIGIFVLLLILKEFFKRTFCALCAAVIITWAGLLAASIYGVFEDSVVVALLMGGTAVGIIYTLEAHVPEKWTIFRLPMYLTLISAAYVSIPPHQVAGGYIVVLLLGVSWAVPALLALWKNEHARKIIERLIACCKNL